MGYAVQKTIFFEEITCGGCGLIYAVPDEWKKRKVEIGAAFSCPNGCSRRFTSETVADKAARLERELSAAKSAQHFAEVKLQDERKRHSSELVRREKRAHAGVCQDCHRTFSNVARHMQTKHGKSPDRKMGRGN